MSARSWRTPSFASGPDSAIACTIAVRSCCSRLAEQWRSASLAVVEGGRVIYEGGLGVRELGKTERVDANTLFMAASNTKGMTTLLLARLVDQGKIRWDEPVIEAYPNSSSAMPS